MTNKIVVLSTCVSRDEAERLAHKLLESHLAACVNVIMQTHSYYWWKGKIEEAEEWLLVIKTNRELFEQVRIALEGAHSYELPEVLAIPVVEGSPNYLEWLDRQLVPSNMNE